MKTKLTLTVDEDVVQKAKKHVEKNEASLSAVVEDFLRTLVTKNKKQSVVDATHGILKGKYSTMNEKGIRSERYKEKYGV